MRRFDECRPSISESVIRFNFGLGTERELEPADDIGEVEAARWETAWIDLGGEG